MCVCVYKIVYNGVKMYSSHVHTYIHNCSVQLHIITHTMHMYVFCRTSLHICTHHSVMCVRQEQPKYGPDTAHHGMCTCVLSVWHTAHRWTLPSKSGPALTAMHRALFQHRYRDMYVHYTLCTSMFSVATQLSSHMPTDNACTYVWISPRDIHTPLQGNLLVISRK